MPREIRMEHTEGLGRTAEVWVDGALLTVIDGLSTREQRTEPGELENVSFRYDCDEGVDWNQAVLENPQHRVAIEHVKGANYTGFGRVEQVMPPIIQFEQLRLQDPNWTTDEGLVGLYVRVPIDRLTLIQTPKEDWPEGL